MRKKKKRRKGEERRPFRSISMLTVHRWKSNGKGKPRRMRHLRCREAEEKRKKVTGGRKRGSYGLWFESHFAAPHHENRRRKKAKRKKKGKKGGRGPGAEKRQKKKKGRERKRICRKKEEEKGDSHRRKSVPYSSHPLPAGNAGRNGRKRGKKERKRGRSSVCCFFVWGGRAGMEKDERAWSCCHVVFSRRRGAKKVREKKERQRGQIFPALFVFFSIASNGGKKKKGKKRNFEVSRARRTGEEKKKRFYINYSPRVRKGRSLKEERDR